MTDESTANEPRGFFEQVIEQAEASAAMHQRIAAELAAGDGDVTTAELVRHAQTCGCVDADRRYRAQHSAEAVEAVDMSRVDDTNTAGLSSDGPLMGGS